MVELTEIKKLAELSRIKMSEDELSAVQKDLNSILEYVGQVQEVAGVNMDEPTAGLLRNVMREDVNPHESGMFTEEILAQSPDRDGQYIRVKKIIEK